MKPGDIVRLKSGGPNMTAKSVGESTSYSTWTFSSGISPQPTPNSTVPGVAHVNCVWFEWFAEEHEWGEPKEFSFPPDTLELVDA